MDLLVSPAKLNGSLTLPPSKSQTMRAILFALLARGESRIETPLTSPDTDCLLKIVVQMGGSFRWEGNTLYVLGRGLRRPISPLYVGNSGILYRFLKATLYPKGATVVGDASMKRRPIQPLLDGLQGKEVDGSDSQTVSALLISSILKDAPTEIRVRNPGELPWIDLTLDWLDRLGVNYEREGYTKYIVRPKSLDAFDYTVPGDVSSASYPALGAILTGGEAKLHGFRPDDPQGDIHLFDILKKMGARVEKESDHLFVSSMPLVGVKESVQRCIDGITLLPVAALFAKGPSHFRDAEIARSKECDRITAICTELRKMGAKIDEKQDGMVVHPSKLFGATVECYSDHRMALSLSIAACKAVSATMIRGFECVSKTYPNFVTEMEKMGAKMELLS